ncbi:MAG: hypothetical protein BWX88_00956 [Planctomycetes bacterium ADurb.Bin126]|nr:MAG: hypothetical protein BWX88_00956 [Planctomycetes bacterium ADurb.Bin126]
MKTLEATKLADLAAALTAAGYRVIAPCQRGDQVHLECYQAGKTLRADVIPVNSAKDALFPRSEVIGRYRFEGNEFETVPVAPQAGKTVLLAVRPCDAAALAPLDAVFNWDYKDEFYNAHRDATTVVALACTAADDQCFCTSVGGSPDSTANADAVLRPADGGKRFILESLTDKGQAIAAAGQAVLTEGQAQADPPAQVAPAFDSAAVTAWAKDGFDSPLWKELSLACMGCGACAYTCPTCHCFDPRHDQASRWRQRVMHKFAYFPERFEMLACTGCGRCGRLCGNGMSIREVCSQIEQAAQAGVK